MLLDALIGVAVGIVVLWLLLVVGLLLARPDTASLREALRLLPDLIRLLRALAGDRSIGRRARVRLWLLFGYLAIPIDLIPDFLPVIGYADDAVIVALVLRSVVRRAGADAVRRNWAGTEAGLDAVWRLARLPQPAS